MKFQWHTPDFMRDGREPREEEEFSWEALKGHERLKRFSGRKDFYRFSQDLYPPRPFPVPFPSTLMAEYKKGREWWVVGHMSEIPEELPLWKPRKSLLSQIRSMLSAEGDL